ncbi:uncharacterized protein BO97DRAFT_415991 [Aspergillus homomorphus CBS 101889]|uniref:Uncharacterized protein n=1 Tax=Aspergillus homomorphus (strain CBS 101889) TaxID=1450537 RepID=A0A395HSI9_ASPHC|nr:hypothetical protein BO97DRAFT_415991 [Aspergillus homomorphus CBS 101889]RAL10459.1 hypothetical protein BO97DRAFT_415991 [Aspergillus homomorphus CBS 101889]
MSCFFLPSFIDTWTGTVMLVTIAITYISVHQARKPSESHSNERFMPSAIPNCLVFPVHLAVLIRRVSGVPSRSLSQPADASKTPHTSEKGSPEKLSILDLDIR